MKTPIDECQDYTHDKEFDQNTKNEDLRNVMRYLADSLSGLQNISSAELSNGIYELDLGKMLHSIENIRERLKSIKVVWSIE